MQRMNRLRLLSATLTALLGCGDDATSPPADGGGDATVVDSSLDTSMPLPDGSPMDCASLVYSMDDPVDTPMLVGETRDDVFTAYAATGHAPFQWGFQGGTMITPEVVLPSELASEGDCVRVTFENLPDPDFPGGADGLQDWSPVEGIDLHRVGANGHTDIIYDQIAWDDPTGWHFLLKVTARGLDFAVTETVALEIDPPLDVPPQCLALETTGEGCVYRRVPGAVTISSMEASTSPGCLDPQRVVGTFAPTDPTHAECYADFATDLAEAQAVTVDYADPPSACLTSYDVGGTIPVVLEVIIAGSCPPYALKVDVPECIDGC